MRCSVTAVLRLSPLLVARPLTTLGHSQWPEPPGFADATATSPAAAVKELSPSRDPTTTRRPDRCGRVRAVRNSLSFRRRCMPSCGAETHLFSSHPAIDGSDTSASSTWGPCRLANPQRPPSEASYEARNEPGERLRSTMAGRSRALFVTKRHIKRHGLACRFWLFSTGHLRNRVGLLLKNEQRCALFYGTVRPPRGWDRILAF